MKSLKDPKDVIVRETPALGEPPCQFNPSEGTEPGAEQALKMLAVIMPRLLRDHRKRLANVSQGPGAALSASRRV